MEASRAMSSSSSNGTSQQRLHRIQKAEGRTNCKRIATASASRTSAAAVAAANNNNSPVNTGFEQLPLNTLVIVASQLPFADFKGLGLVSKKFSTVQRTTRYSRKRISVDLLRRLFPEETIPMFNGAAATNAVNGQGGNKDDEQITGAEDSCVGMLQMMRPFRNTLRASPPRNINEVDLSEFSAFRESHFDELLKSVNNGREIFAEVRRLSVQGCVLEIKDMAFLAKLMPKVWFIRCSARTLVVPESTEQKAPLSVEQMQSLRTRVENFEQVWRQFTRKQLWFLAQLTQLFPCLEMVQLDN